MAGPYNNNYYRGTSPSYSLINEQTWYTSDRRPDGSLVLHAQPYRFRKVVQSQLMKSQPIFGDPYPGYDETQYVRLISDELDNRALNKFRKSFRDGRAELGVTLGTWRQSSEMIVSRSRWAHRKLSSLEEKAIRIGRARYRTRKARREAFANFHLEVVFGWQPLFTDVFKAMSLATDPFREDQRHYVCRGAAEGFVSDIMRQGSSPETTRVFEGKVRICHAAMASIENPNAYLANKLGVINPARVIWDIIPWSWVVGMFVNANDLISSLTDDVGLNYRDYSATRTVIGTEHATTVYKSPPYPQSQAGFTSSVYLHRYKKRNVGGIPPNPSLVLRVPDFSWSLAAIAFSVVTQRVKRFNNFLTIPFS